MIQTMAKKDKLIERLLTKPKDFTWAELHKVMIGFDFRVSNKGKTSGSRVRFIHDEHAPFNMHKPHPRPILKGYQLDNVINFLKQEGLV